MSGCEIELAFQFPFSVLDRRFEEVNMPQRKRYARSIFLQGLLASSKSLNKKAPEPLLNLQRNYHSVLEKKGIDPIDLALSFVFYSKKIDYFLVGVNTVYQLNEILNIEIDELNKMKDFDIPNFEFERKWLDPKKWE